MRLLFLLSVISILVSSCGKEESQAESQAEINARNDQEIATYIADNNITGTIETESGLVVKIDEEGSADKPTLSSMVSVTYDGTLIDGSRFDGTNTPVTFPLTGVIIGWQEGIPYFGKGGNGTLFIPSRLAYGNRDTGSIPAGSVLIFDVEVVDF